MNERIKELWEQGTFTVMPREGDYSSVSTDNIKKFAELIVRECEQVSLKNSYRDDDMGAIIARQIIEHFGVEE